MNIMANGREAAIPAAFKTIPNRTGTLRIRFSTIADMIIAQISITR